MISMKVLNYRHENSIKIGILREPEQIVNLEHIISAMGKDLNLVEHDLSFIENYYRLKPELAAFLKQSSREIKAMPISEVEILAPVLHPSKIICLGLNYKDHAKETRQKLPRLPMLFAKAPTAILGMDGTIIIPQVHKSKEKNPRPIQFIDYEVELAIIMGQKCKGVFIEDAQNYILGYTILNDVSARMEQIADKQFFRSKSFDTFAPLGPWIVTSDEIGDPMNLNIECRVNGEIMQASNTRNMNFSVFEIVSFISEAITLLPGDIIGTGTPPGVGAAQKPPRSLRPGDMVEMNIENIGTLRNKVR